MNKPALGPWIPHIEALEHGYRVKLIRRNITLPRDREYDTDPWPTFTLAGAVRRGTRLAKRKNRAEERIARRQARIDLQPWLDDAVDRADS